MRDARRRAYRACSSARSGSSSTRTPAATRCRATDSAVSFCSPRRSRRTLPSRSDGVIDAGRSGSATKVRSADSGITRRRSCLPSRPAPGRSRRSPERSSRRPRGRSSPRRSSRGPRAGRSARSRAGGTSSATWSSRVPGSGPRDT
ncbi:hypothetical protein Ae150APs1_6281c [Pseudonocardia sp. Ae150A_Ps1]|nr:hypothetical protein Ae150APs1_6281c [Pseudonocardia sp. Ae150A_Ps1]